MFKYNLANNIKNLRIQNKLTQSELSEKLGITRQSLSNYEKGIREPDVAVLTAIANYFNCSVDYLLFDSTDNNLDMIYSNFDIDDIMDYNSLILKYMLNKKEQLKKVSLNISTEIDKVNRIINLINHSKHNTELSSDFLDEVKNESNKISIPIINKRFECMKISDMKIFDGYISTHLKSPLSLDKKNNYYIFTVLDDSMNTLFKINEKIIIENTNVVNNGDIAVVLINNCEMTIKKIFFIDNYIKLIPLSKKESYKVEVYDLNKIDVQVQGKYIVKLDDYL